MGEERGGVPVRAEPEELEVGEAFGAQERVEARGRLLHRQALFAQEETRAGP